MKRRLALMLVIAFVVSEAIYAEEGQGGSSASDDSGDIWTWADNLNRGTKEASDRISAGGSTGAQVAGADKWNSELRRTFAAQEQAAGASRRLRDLTENMPPDPKVRVGRQPRRSSRAALDALEAGKASRRAKLARIGLRRARNELGEAADRLEEAAKNLGNLGEQTGAERWAGGVAGAGKIFGAGVDARGVYTEYQKEGAPGAVKEILHNMGKDMYSAPFATAGAEAGFCVGGPPGAMLGGIGAGICGAIIYESGIKPTLDREVFDPAIRAGKKAAHDNPFSIIGRVAAKVGDDHKNEMWEAWKVAVQSCESSSRAIREAKQLAQNALDDAFIASRSSQSALDSVLAIKGTIDSALATCNGAPTAQAIFDLGASILTSASGVERQISAAMSAANAVCEMANNLAAPPDVTSGQSQLNTATTNAGDARTGYGNLRAEATRLTNDNGIRNAAIQNAKSANSTYTNAKATVLIMMQTLNQNTNALQGAPSKVQEAKRLNGVCQDKQNFAQPNSFGKPRMHVDLSQAGSILQMVTDAKAKLAETRQGASSALAKIEGMGAGLSECAALSPVTIDHDIGKAEAPNVAGLDTALANGQACLNTLVARATPTGDGDEKDVGDLRGAEEETNQMGGGDTPNSEGIQIASARNTAGEGMDNIRSRASGETDDAQRDMGTTQDERSTASAGRHGTEMEGIARQGRQAENALATAREQHASAESSRQTGRAERDQIGGAVGRGMIEGGAALGASLGAPLGTAAGGYVSQETNIVEPARDDHSDGNGANGTGGSGSNRSGGSNAGGSSCDNARGEVSTLSAQLNKNPGDSSTLSALQAAQRNVESACAKDNGGGDQAVADNRGCTEVEAKNYDSNATIDDGSCEYREGCMDSTASNYDAWAYISDGSCQYSGASSTTPTTTTTPAPSGGGGGGGGGSPPP